MAQNVLSPLSLSPKGSPGEVLIYKLEDAITATNTPVALQVAGAKSIGIHFIEAGTVLNRSGALTITASMDGGVTYKAYALLVANLVNAITEGVTRIASKTLNSVSNDLLWFDPASVGPITHIKALCTVTDGATPTGNFTVVAAVGY